MASISCENCGFKGAALPSGACPRCGAAPRGETFRVPPLPAPSSAVASDIEPDRQVPPGGYLDLDLGDAGRGADSAAVAAPRERRRTGRTGPAFAAIAPKEIPGSPRSVIPIFVAVGVGCLALIIAGVLVSRGGDKAPTPVPAQTAAPSPALAPPSAPAPAAAPPAEGSPAAASPTVLAAPSAPAPEPAAQIVPDPRAESRTERGRRTAPAQPVRLTRPNRPEREASRPEPAAAPAPQPAPVQAAAPPPPPVAPAPAAPAQIEDAPRYPAEGFRRPQMTQPQCVQNAIRAPRDLADRLSGPVTIRFAVGPEGDVSLFQIMGDTPDPRLPDLLENAVRACAFTPGTDAQGKPIRMWVTMPIRFAR